MRRDERSHWRRQGTPQTPDLRSKDLTGARVSTGPLIRYFEYVIHIADVIQIRREDFILRQHYLQKNRRIRHVTDKSFQLELVGVRRTGVENQAITL